MMPWRSARAILDDLRLFDDGGAALVAARAEIERRESQEKVVQLRP
jgi:hypothetical protein